MQRTHSVTECIVHHHHHRRANSTTTVLFMRSYGVWYLQCMMYCFELIDREASVGQEVSGVQLALDAGERARLEVGRWASLSSCDDGYSVEKMSFCRAFEGIELHDCVEKLQKRAERGDKLAEVCGDELI